MSEYKTIIVGDDWVDVGTEAGIIDGYSYKVQNNSVSNVLVHTGDKPFKESNVGSVLTRGGTPYSVKELVKVVGETTYMKSVGKFPARITTQFSPIQRYITSLSAAGSMYYELSEPITIGAGEDFEITLKYSTTNTNNQILIGDDYASTYYFNLDATNFNVWVSGTEYQYNHQGNAHGGIEHEVAYILSGSSLTVVLDGISLGAKIITPYTGENNFLIGSSNTNSVYFTGELYDLKIWTGGDRNTGALVLDLPIDEDWKKNNLVNNKATTLGSNLWPSNSSATLVQDGSNTATLVNDTIELRGGYGRAYYLAEISAGDNYVIEIDADINVGTLSIFAGDGGDEAAQRVVGWGEVDVSSGVVFITATNDADRIIITSRGAGGSSDLRSLSVRNVPAGYPLATAINITEDEAEFYTKVDSGASWLGSDLWEIKQDLSLGFGWTDNGDGTYTISGAQSGLSFSAVRGVSAGRNYRVAYTVTDYTDGTHRMAASSLNSLDLTGNGRFTSDLLNTSGSDTRTYIITNADGEFTMRPSTKRLIPIAGGA